MGVVLVGLAIVAALFVLYTRRPDEARSVFSAAWQLANGVSWLLISLVTLAGRLGAPAVAAGAGLLATLTCVLGMLWLWVVGRSHNWRAQPVSAAQ